MNRAEEEAEIKTHKDEADARALALIPKLIEELKEKFSNRINDYINIYYKHDPYSAVRDLETGIEARFRAPRGMDEFSAPCNKELIAIDYIKQRQRALEQSVDCRLLLSRAKRAEQRASKWRAEADRLAKELRRLQRAEDRRKARKKANG